MAEHRLVVIRDASHDVSRHAAGLRTPRGLLAHCPSRSRTRTTPAAGGGQHDVTLDPGLLPASEAGAAPRRLDVWRAPGEGREARLPGTDVHPTTPRPGERSAVPVDPDELAARGKMPAPADARPADSVTETQRGPPEANIVPVSVGTGRRSARAPIHTCNPDVPAAVIE